MNDIITTKSIAPGVADVEEDFVLSEEPMSRLVFHAQIHNKGIKGKIIRQRRESKQDFWVPEEAIDIRTLGKKESINLSLDTASVGRLYEAISKLANILAKRGVQYGEKQYAVVDPDSVIINNSNKATYIRKLIEAGYSEDVWSNLAESDPSLVTKLSYARVFSERKKVLKEFYRSLSLSKDESYWQQYFKKNTWIFGYGLKYQFLNLITDQPKYSGSAYHGKGEQRGDFLMNSEAEKKFTMLVEIKKPDTELVLREEYRSGTWKLGHEMLWAVSQIQINCSSWFRDGSKHDDARDDLENNQIYTYEPKGILVIGHTSQLNNRTKIQTFEAYRRGLLNPEIITFDELYNRAKFIIEHNQAKS